LGSGEKGCQEIGDLFIQRLVSQIATRSDGNLGVHFMESEVPSSCSQDPATDHYPEPHESIPQIPHPISLISILILSSHLRLSFTSGLFHTGFRTKILFGVLNSPFRPTFPAHLILLDSITLIVFSKAYTL